MKNTLLFKNGFQNQRNSLSWFCLFSFLVLFGNQGWGQVIISQVYEGASNNKWIEITNVGSASINLATPTQYKIGIWTKTNSTGNGAISGTPTNSISLTGTLAVGARYLIKNTSASATVPHNPMPTANNTNTSVAGFNGNDALALFTGTSTIVDAFGVGINNVDFSYHRNSGILATNATFTVSEWTIKTLAEVASATNSVSEYIGVHIYSSAAAPNLVISGTPTNNGTVCPGVAATGIVYTITNTGTLAAEGVSVATTDTQFAVSGLSATTIAAGDTATYTVTFTPTSSGAKTAIITASSTTSGSNSATSNLTGTGVTAVAQTVTTAAASALTGSSATLNGNVTALGVCPASTEKGFVYATTAANNNPTVGGSGVTKTAVSSLATGAYTLGLSGLPSGTSYTYKAYIYDGSTYTYGAATTFATLSPAPEIDVKQGAVSIADSGTYDVGSQLMGTSGTPTPFTIENTGNANLTFSSITSSNTSDFTLNTTASSSPIAALGTTTFTVTFNPLATGVKTTTITITNNDSNEGTYTFTVSGTGTTSLSSDIIANATYAASGYNSNIAYASYQTATITNTSNSLDVFKFDLRDGGGSADADALPTVLNAIAFNVTGIANIRTAALFNGNALVNANPTINTGAGTISFTGLSGANVTAADGGTTSLTLRVSFNSAVTDNSQLQVTIANTDVAVAGSSTSSGFSAFANVVSLTTADRNRIEVLADRLRFETQPVDSAVNTNLAAFTVNALDSNSNLDLDAVNSLALTTSGTGMTATSPYVLSGGSVSISDVQFATGQSAITLTATTTGLGFDNDDVSTPFSITTVASGTYRSTGAGNWATTATWERLVGGVWTSGLTPATSTTDLVYIRHAISSNGSITPANVSIETGGTLTITAPSTIGTALQVNSGGLLQLDASPTINGTFTVESGGRVNINSTNISGASAIWDGTENFKDGSTFEIQNWSYGAGGDAKRVIQNPSSISANAGGYYFGNLICSGAPASIFIMSVGSQTINLAQNDFTVAVSGNNVAFTNASSNVTVGGNVSVTSGQLSMGATTNGSPIVTILGDLVATGGIININQGSSLNATTEVNLAGNLSVSSGATLTSNDPGSSLIFSGTVPQTVSIAGTLGANVDFSVASGATAQLINQNLALANASDTFTVLAGGTLAFNGFNVTGSGTFIQASTGTLKITAAEGVNATGNNTGNVQNTGTRTFSQTGYFHYVGNVSPQSTGTAMTTGSTAKQIVINKTNATDSVNLTQSTGTSSLLQINNGIFVETAAANITGSGALTMSGGTYKTAVLSPSTLPQLSGTYTLSGGTIDLNAAGNQILNGTPTYNNITFSTSGTKTLSSATSTISGGTVTIQNAAIVDAGATTLGGTGTNLTMTGTSRLIVSGARTVPDMTGTYSLTGGTVEFSGNSNSHTARAATTYYNVEITGANVNASTGNYTLANGGSFTVFPTAAFSVTNQRIIAGGAAATVTVNGTFNTADGDGFSGSNLTSVSPTNISLSLGASSTIQYNGSTAQTVSARTDYANVMIANASGATLNGAATVSGILTLTTGTLTLGANTLTIGSLGSIAVTAPSATKMIVATGTGELRKVFTGVGSFLYPIGDATSTAEYSPVTLDFTSGTFASAYAGLRVTNAKHPNNASTTDYINRYWTVSGSGISSPVYTASFVYADGDIAGTEANLFGGLYSSSTWTCLDAVTVATNTISKSIVAFGAVTAGDGSAMGCCAVPTVGGTVASNQTICSGTVPANLTLSGHTGSIIKWQSATDAAFTTPTDIAATTTTLSGATIGALTATTYFRAVVQNGSCLVLNSNYSTVTVNLTTTWTGTNGTAWSNGSNWSCGVVPSSAVSVTIPAVSNQPIISSDAFAESLTLATGATVTVSGASDLTVTNGIANSGTVTIENNANLVQVNAVSNTGSGATIVKRNSSALKRLDYTLWSSPVTGQNLLAFSPLTLANRFYTYNSIANIDNPTGLYNVIASPSTTSFAAAKGYLIRMPNTHPSSATVWNGQFSGVPHNGDYSYTMQDGGVNQRFNLVGNPYPSPINAITFVNSNSSKITGTLYFWRKTNDKNNPSYCSMTTLGFVGNGQAQVADPSHVIQTGQGFFVEGNGTTDKTVTFTNAMRVGNNANHFFRTATTPEQHRIWLNATNSLGSYSQLLVGYTANATNGVDQGIDGRFINDGDIALSSLIGNAEYVIQGRPLPFSATDVVPLRFKATTADTYTLAIDRQDGIFSSGQTVYIKDNLTHSVHNLSTGSYSFASDAGEFATRFEIVYQNTLAIQQPVFTAAAVVVYKQNQELVINTGTTAMAQVKVYDIRGRLLAEKNHINATETRMVVGVANEVLLVQIFSQDSGVVTKKVVH